jgi:hypothetical protein
MTRRTWRGREQAIENVRTEIEVMRKVNHPNCITLETVYESANHIYIVMELVPATRHPPRPRQLPPTRRPPPALRPAPRASARHGRACAPLRQQAGGHGACGRVGLWR